MRHDTQYDNDGFTHPDHPGWEFEVEYHYDHDHGAPWDEHDGHGPVRQEHGARYRSDHQYGTGKGAGEVVLHESGGTLWIYDFKGALETAKRDGWGISPEADLGERERLVYRRMSRGERNLCRSDELRARANCISLTPGQKRVCAVNADMKYLRRWLRGDWSWCGLVVKVTTCPPEMADLMGADESESCWGFESDAGAYLKECALDMADTLVRRLTSPENVQMTRDRLLARAQAATEAAQRLEALAGGSAP